MAYDSHRGVLMVFGSDTHGENWDNAVHEFDPLRKRWTTSHLPAPPESYRSDALGRAIAGVGAEQPWAMHTYDGVVYDPARRAMVVAASPAHNPRARHVSGIKQHPIWLYDPAKGRWHQHENSGEPTPQFFGSGTAYDEHRDTIVVYKRGLWELGPERTQWLRRATENHHELHYSLEYDPWRRKLFVFGDYRPTCVVWSYTPGGGVEDAKRWTRLEPEGDCPPLTNTPVAFDRRRGVFLLVVNDRIGGRAASTASTYIYDPDANRYVHLPHGRLPAIGMNYMMAWDRRHEVFLLVAGKPGAAVQVWALRLDGQDRSIEGPGPGQ